MTHASGEASSPPSSGVVLHSTVGDVDSYRRSVAGVEIEATRLGIGSGANTVEATVDGRFVATSCTIGFPIATRSTVPDDRFLIASMASAPPGSRWCEVDLQPGTTMVYAPGAEHLARNLPGLRFTFTVVAAETLAARAEELGVPANSVVRGRVRDVTAGPGASAVAQRLLSIPRRRNGLPPACEQDELISAITTMLAGPGAMRRREPSRHLDRRRLVARCLDFADSIERPPTTTELCVASGASARRVRRAFVSVFGMPPRAYFQRRLLTRARRLLVSGGSSGDTVTTVAVRLGFDHLGRFSHYYERVHGELPHMTLISGGAG